MNEGYLWDKSGEPDKEVRRLEDLLAPYRHGASKRRRSPPPLTVAGAIAAAIALVLTGAFLWRGAEVSAWRMDGRQLALGETVASGGAGRLLEADEFGNVNLAPGSKLRVLRAARGKQVLALQEGRMKAVIWAPPGRFAVDTPSAKAIDLGCAYEVSVLPDGSGWVVVHAGWVAFEHRGTESFIPAGAKCRTRPGKGPGLPYLESAPPALQQSVERFETTDGRDGLGGILTSARSEDRLTLWHLLARTHGDARAMVVKRFAAMVPGVDTAALVQGRPVALDAAWNQLGLGETNWWRVWKRDWDR